MHDRRATVGLRRLCSLSASLCQHPYRSKRTIDVRPIRPPRVDVVVHIHRRTMIGRRGLTGTNQTRPVATFSSGECGTVERIHQFRDTVGRTRCTAAARRQGRLKVEATFRWVFRATLFGAFTDLSITRQQRSDLGLCIRTGPTEGRRCVFTVE